MSSQLTPQHWQAYHALQRAAERIGANGYQEALDDRLRRGLKPIRRDGVSIYTPTAAHEEVIEAMKLLLRDEVSPDGAMCLLWRADIQREMGI
jgi:hypothetical protein